MTNTIPCCEGDNGGGVEVVNSVDSSVHRDPPQRLRERWTVEGELGEFRTTDACRGKGDAGRDVLPTANRGRHIQRERV